MSAHFWRVAVVLFAIGATAAGRAPAQPERLAETDTSMVIRVPSAPVENTEAGDLPPEQPDCDADVFIDDDRNGLADWAEGPPYTCFLRRLNVARLPILSGCVLDTLAFSEHQLSVFPRIVGASRNVWIAARSSGDRLAPRVEAFGHRGRPVLLKPALNPMSHFPGEMYEFDARTADSLVAIRITLGRISRYAIVRLTPRSR